MSGNEDSTPSEYLFQPIESYDRPAVIGSYEEIQPEPIVFYDEIQPETFEYYNELQSAPFASYDEFQLNPGAIPDLSYLDNIEKYPIRAEEEILSSFHEPQDLQYTLPLEEEKLNVQSLLYGLEPAIAEDRLGLEDLLRHSIEEQYVPEDMNTDYTSLDYMPFSSAEYLDGEYVVDPVDTDIQWPFVDSEVYEATPGKWSNERHVDSPYPKDPPYFPSSIDNSLYASAAEGVNELPQLNSPDPYSESYDTLSTIFSLPSLASTLHDIEAVIISEELSKTLLLPNPVIEDFGLFNSDSEYLWTNGGGLLYTPDAETLQPKTTSDWNSSDDKEGNSNFETFIPLDYGYPFEEAESVKSLVETEEPDRNVFLPNSNDKLQVEDESDTKKEDSGNEQDHPDNKEEPENEQEGSENEEEKPDVEEEEPENEEEKPDVVEEEPDDENSDSLEEKPDTVEMIKINEKMQVPGESTSEADEAKPDAESDREGKAESTENSVKSVEESEIEEEIESKTDKEIFANKQENETEDSVEVDDESNEDDENMEEDNSPASEEESSEAAEDSSESKQDEEAQDSYEDSETASKKIISIKTLPMPTPSFKVAVNYDNSNEDSEGGLLYKKTKLNISLQNNM
ncbi:unnamed protein product [Auanema sp. JU1783]|nr:unnamed protein product [Auanema sp. JU1783]